MTTKRSFTTLTAGQQGSRIRGREGDPADRIRRREGETESHRKRCSSERSQDESGAQNDAEGNDAGCDIIKLFVSFVIGAQAKQANVFEPRIQYLSVRLG